MNLPPLVFTHPRGECTVTFEVYQEGGETICGLVELIGHLDLPPKQWLRTLRHSMGEVESKVRDAGCVEMRVAGRDWSRVLPDYEPLPGGKPNRLRKRL